MASASPGLRERIRGIPSRIISPVIISGLISGTLKHQIFAVIKDDNRSASAAPATILIIFSTCLLPLLAWLCGRNQPD
ncbi:MULTISPECIES: hypothetical protein [unclassified Herbaspirillum]|uniref:hypothetical protein n=1 Tax=unclassified Herbaspirillum TaxID=2624150 RepID=UPI001153C6C6|nr:MULTISPECIES: hypothetical protein [unclassified Herbaspirillum]MBB5390199.1 ABC-type spermidine/putrescine transport system permease subunit II [Herbaspirillum sp. SJZ102]